MATATEEQVRTEQEDYEAEQAEEDVGPAGARTGDVEPAADGKSLFDREAYKAPGLQLDQVDGQDVDKIWIPVTGRVALDRKNPAHVALFRKLVLGREVELRVTGTCVKVGTGFTTSKDGDLDAVVGERTVKVTDIYALEPEELT